MDLREYQKGVQEAASPAYTKEIAAIALAEEAGEICGVIKKTAIYNDFSKFEAKYGMTVEEKIADECGDLIWQLMNLLNQYGLDFYDVVQMNVRKLIERHGSFTTTKNDGGKR